MKRFYNTLFYGNLYYGICTVALSIESNFQHGISLNSIRFYVLAFLATSLFYSYIYYKSSVFFDADERTSWYRKNRAAIRLALIVATTLLIADILLIGFINRAVLFHLSVYHFILLSLVPLICFMYVFEVFQLKKLRKIGWLKPFVIGFVWTGVVTILPVFFWQTQHPNHQFPDVQNKVLLWLQNFIFISTLAIIFDIKDFDLDRKYHLNTYAATLGISKTIQLVVLPLTFIGLIISLVYNLQFDRTLLQILLQSLPYIVLALLAVKSFKQERSLLFYLAVIDGLMLFKGICGIVSFTCFN